MLSGIVVGYDPGGNSAHGFAELRVEGGTAAKLSTATLDTAEDMIARVERLSSVLALGVDTLSFWGTGTSGWRPADLWLRRQYKPVQHSVISPNGLFGSMGLSGMSVLISARRRFPDVPITETHPKVLYWLLRGKKYDYEYAKREMDAVLARSLGTQAAPVTEHEWDAAISAPAALEGVAGRWTHGLHKLPVNTGQRTVAPCGSTNYFWPE